ncbi:MAG TPA: transglutaminase-like domain-containing protein, partial [Chitinophagaceae bacterium]
HLNKDNGWLSDIMSEALKNASTPMDKAKNIYAWVRDNYTCTSHDRIAMDQPLRNKAKVRSGTVAEINLLLVAMLRKANITADPVILSTRSNGFTYSLYPLLNRFNYLICRIELDEKYIFLDASHPLLGFGKLETECYNGHARVIDENCFAIELSPESIKETDAATIFIINDEKGKSVGSFQKQVGDYQSYWLRDHIKEKGKEQYIKEIQKDFGTDINISQERIDSIAKYDEPVGIFFEFDIKGWEDDIVYVNPMFGEGFKENPFKSAQRLYPVEMPYTMDKLFSLQFEVPVGYEVDELPKQAVVKFNEQEDAIFEYRISQSGSSISLRSRVRIKRAYFEPEEYETLREFFNLIVKKHNEQIVFKKKK